MKIAYKKAVKIVTDPVNRKYWVSVVDNPHGVLYWHTITGEILWIGSDADGNCNINKPRGT